MKTQHPPLEFKAFDTDVPLTCRVAGMSSERLLYELREISSFFKYGGVSMGELALREQMIALLEAREVPDDVIDGVCAHGAWDGERICDQMYGVDGFERERCAINAID